MFNDIANGRIIFRGSDRLGKIKVGKLSLLLKKAFPLRVKRY